MLTLPAELIRSYDTLLGQKGIAMEHRPHYKKWLRYYWDFCHKYDLGPRQRQSLPRFDEKLRAKHQSDFQRHQARHAVSLYYDLVLSTRNAGQPLQVLVNGSKNLDATVSVPPREGAATSASPVRPLSDRERTTEKGKPLPSLHPQLPPNALSPQVRKLVDLSSPKVDRSVQLLPRANPRDSAGLKLAGASWVSVYDRLSSAVKVRHYSPKTLQAYKGWTQKFQTFTKSKDPQVASMGDVKGFLSYLAVDRKVSASSQNQAFNALLFLFNHVLGKEFEKVEGVVRAKRTTYIPVVLSRAEVDRVIRFLEHPFNLVAKLLYGCGLRLFECLKLRVQDLNFEMSVLTVHDGKGRKDRTLPLPKVLAPELNKQLETVRQVHREDLAAGYAGTFLPGALGEKYKRAEKELVWQWLFPAKTLTQVPTTREYRRYHYMKPMYKRRSKGRCRAARSQNGRPPIRSGTVLPATYCKRTMTFARNEYTLAPALQSSACK